jgi:fibronectin-binding autotransporter adhesin
MKCVAPFPVLRRQFPAWPAAALLGILLTPCVAHAKSGTAKAPVRIPSVGSYSGAVSMGASLTGSISTTGAGSLTVSSGALSSASATLNLGTGSVITTGAGTLLLNGNNPFSDSGSASITISGSTLDLRTGVNSGATLVLNPGAYAWSGYSGNVTISAGTLNLGTGVNSAGTLILNPGSLSGSNSIINSGTLTLGQVVTGYGPFSVTTANTLVNSGTLATGTVISSQGSTLALTSPTLASGVLAANTLRPQVLPEPSSALLALIGAGLLAPRRRRRS